MIVWIVRKKGREIEKVVRDDVIGEAGVFDWREREREVFVCDDVIGRRRKDI